jgi:hypothetical protein
MPIFSTDALTKKEIWKVIPGFPKYEISSLGRVKNAGNKNILKQYIYNGYLRVGLYNDTSHSTDCILHRLLALTFLANSEKYNCVDHINGDKLDNSLTNLRWCSYSTSNKNWHSNRTNFKKVIQYIPDGKDILWNSAAEAAYELGFDASNIRKCCNPNIEKETYMKFVWKYADPAHQIPREDIDYNQYACIGIINGLDFSNFWIKIDGTKVVNKKNNKEIAYETTSSYIRYPLVSKTNVHKKMFLHKIINQIFLNGTYEDTVTYLDGNKLNNNFANLKVMSLKGAMTKAMGIKVKQINKDTGEIITTFNSIADAGRHLGKTNTSSISRACNGKQNIAYGFRWKKV